MNTGGTGKKHHARPMQVFEGCYTGGLDGSLDLVMQTYQKCRELKEKSLLKAGPFEPISRFMCGVSGEKV